jgi:hypothetical protein
MALPNPVVRYIRTCSLMLRNRETPGNGSEAANSAVDEGVVAGIELGCPRHDDSRDATKYDGQRDDDQQIACAPCKE